MEPVRTLIALGPYVVDARIGSGGMGVVYRARHRVTGAAAALKTVQVDTAEHLAAFRREVQVLAQLEHPGIVRILDHGIAEGTPWYAMDLVRGRPLSNLLRGHLATETEVVLGAAARSTAPVTEEVDRRDASSPRLRLASEVSARERQDGPTPNELLRIVRKVCSALGFLHSHGLVHRDLKPENILIQEDGTPILVDFGIVGQFGDSRGREVLSLTRSAGTLAYMAPEQAAGLFIDARADLFSLGCILYECLVGRVPFGLSGLYDLSLPLPEAPSQLVGGVSPELDELVMGLLAKEPRERVGYADDVASALDRVLAGEDATRSVTQQAAYLYRPDFAGRAEALERLARIVGKPHERACSVTLISGESGLGKTRLLLELGGRAVAAGVTVITGECRPVGAIALDWGARAEALHPFKNFLLTVADVCRTGGGEVSARLLEGRGAVLAAFEPALGELLGEQERKLPELSPELARTRVFAALEGLLDAFAREKPLSFLLLIDDLQWADSLSLELLAALANRRRRPSYHVVATYRGEEVSAELGMLVSLASVGHERLDRFDRTATREMVSGMLAVAEPPEDWVAFLEEESGGNPFFIAEYLRAAISERLLTRTRAGRWALETVEEGDDLRARLGLPATIGALVGRRLSGLDDDARLTVQAAAVLGREFDMGLVAETAGLELSVVSAAYARLRQRQILDDEASRGGGFVHDKLREIAYGLIDVGLRSQMHGRAARALMARQARGEAALEPGALGYHFAQAGDPARAADYFEQAAAHARARYANRDAVRFYRLALFELDRAASGGAPPAAVTSRVREALAEVLLLSNELVDARSALEKALADTPVEQHVPRARRQRLLARTWERQHQHEQALAAYARAEQDLGQSPLAGEDGEQFWFEQVQIQIQSTWSLYFLSRLTELSQRIEHVRPQIEARGTALQRAQFFSALSHMNARRNRYRITPQILEYARASLLAAEQQSDVVELAMGHFTLAFPLMFDGQDREAEHHYLEAIAGAERVGDATFQARFLAYYTICLRRLRRVADARAAAQRTLEISLEKGFNDYVGVAHANLCWVALEEGGDVESAAADALAAWARLPPGYPYPMSWLARIPLAVYLTQRGRVAEALEQWQPLLDEAQYLLPDELNEAIRAAAAKRTMGGVSDASDALRLVNLARTLHYA
jgi:hypothetical protein